MKSSEIKIWTQGVLVAMQTVTMSLTLCFVRSHLFSLSAFISCELATLLLKPNISVYLDHCSMLVFTLNISTGKQQAGHFCVVLFNQFDRKTLFYRISHSSWHFIEFIL